MEPYPDTYDGLLEISRQEMADDTRPEMAGIVENMDAMHPSVTLGANYNDRKFPASLIFVMLQFFLMDQGYHYEIY